MTSFFDLRDRAIILLKKFTELKQHQGRREWTRGDIVKGFVGDVGGVVKLTMAADGLRKVPGYKEKLGHELADCLWSLFVIPHEYSVDIEKEFVKLSDHLNATIDTALNSEKQSPST